MSILDVWRRNLLRRYYINFRQQKYFKLVGGGNNSNVILFLTPGKDRVNGGIMSIISLAEETAKLNVFHGASVFVCTVPGDPPLLKYTKFENSTKLMDLELVLKRLPVNSKVLVHVPEIFVARFGGMIEHIAKSYSSFAWGFNVLLQNIDAAPSRETVQSFKKFGKITCTTAHEAYSNASTAEALGCEVHHFSAYGSPEKYIYKRHDEKDNIIIVSPDKAANRTSIMNSIKKRLSGFEFIVIKGLTYQEYKALISRAKFSITFGEGLDGYFSEPIFSGGIGAAVYNDRFFTEDFLSLPFVYDSWESFEENYPKDVIAADNQQEYQAIHSRQFELLASKYSHDKYIQNLTRFYAQLNFFNR